MAKTFPCPQCSAAVEMLSADSLSAVCPNCRMALEPTPAGINRLGTATLTGNAPVLRVGMRGQFHDREVVLIGLTRHVVEQWYWDNFLLLDSQGELEWLSYDSFRFKLSQDPEELPHEPGTSLSVSVDASSNQVMVGPERFEILETGVAELAYCEGELPWPARPGESLRFLVTEKYVVEWVGANADIVVPVRVSHSEIRKAFNLPWWWRRLDIFSSAAMPVRGDPRVWNAFKIAGAGGIGLSVLACAGVFSGCDDHRKPPGGDFAADKLVWHRTVDRDSTGSADWQAFANTAALTRAWEPPADSPWLAFHKPTLFSMADALGGSLKPVRPTESPEKIDADIQAVISSLAKPGDPIPNLADTAIIIDLPGAYSTAWATAVARQYGHQVVCTVNNLPHQNGVVAHHETIGALVYHARQVEHLRLTGKVKPGAPPVFVLDRNRLRTDKVIGADTFDNRYFHEQGEFPAAAALAARGITNVWYVHPPVAAGGHWDSDDMNPYLCALDAAGIIKLIPIEASVPADPTSSTARTASSTTRASHHSARPVHRTSLIIPLLVRSGGGFGGSSGFKPATSSSSRSWFSGSGG